MNVTFVQGSLIINISYFRYRLSKFAQFELRLSQESRQDKPCYSKMGIKGQEKDRDIELVCSYAAYALMCLLSTNIIWYQYFLSTNIIGYQYFLSTNIIGYQYFLSTNIIGYQYFPSINIIGYQYFLSTNIIRYQYILSINIIWYNIFLVPI